MCLILLAYQSHPDYPLIIAANRDEFLDRPTAAAQFWPEHPALLAGKDLQAGGTWMGITRNGRLAAVTNVREPEITNTRLHSRGELTNRYLLGQEHAQSYLQRLHSRHHQYAGFNLLTGQLNDLWFYSNRDHSISALSPGIYGISNGGFDEHWPKVGKGKKALGKALHEFRGGRSLLPLLQDNEVAADALLPDTGVGIETERWLSPLFIQHPGYGTRSSTVITLSQQGVIEFWEQTYEDGEPTQLQHIEFAVETKVP